MAQKSLVISLLQRILLSHTRVSNGNDEAATAYVARFTRRILSAIGNESRAGSPKLGNDMAKGETVVDQPDFMAQLVSNLPDIVRSDAKLFDLPVSLDTDSCCQEEYIRVPEETTQTELDDEQYWFVAIPPSVPALTHNHRAMLFSAAPENNAAPSTSMWGGQDTSQELLGYSNPFL